MPASHRHAAPASALALLCLALPLAAQAPVDAGPGPRPDPGHIALFRDRSFTLDGLRSIIRGRGTAAQLAREITRLEGLVRQDQAGFVTRVRELGGRVHRQWWLINGCAFELPQRQLAALRAWPGLHSIQPDATRRPLLVGSDRPLEDATSAALHNSDAANLRRDARGQRLDGQGLSLGILDSGIDLDHSQASRPHACLFPGGDPNNSSGPGISGSRLMAAHSVVSGSSAEDSTGHGTGVASCAVAANWNQLAGVDDGIAPAGQLVSCNIANGLGLSSDSWLISGWQYLVSQRLAFEIVVGNNSYSGSPRLDNALQLALDSAAYHGDMLICVAAGNFGSNTSESQHAFNGIAVGAIDKTWKLPSSFSAQGPLHGTQRSYPDLVAVGEQMVCAEHDLESGRRIDSGTSYAAGLVAGSALLVRQARPDLDANCARALLLHSARFRSNNRNEYGTGMLDTDAAVAQTLAAAAVRGSVSPTQPKANFPLWVSGATTVVTCSWMRQDIRAGVAPPDLDLRVFDAQGQLIAEDRNPANSYEQLRLQGLASGTYRIEVEWSNARPGDPRLGFALVAPISSTPASIQSLNPGTVQSYQPGWIEVRGSGLAEVSGAEIDGQAAGDILPVDDQSLFFRPPELLSIGTHGLRLIDTQGPSNTVALQIRGQQVPILTGPTRVTRSNTAPPQTFAIHADRGYLTLLCASPDRVRSHLPQIMDLQIGKGFTSLVPLIYLNHDAAGRAALQVPFPSSLPPSTVYLQALTTHPQQPVTPYPASNVLTLLIQ